jgi:hypothetical protein
VPPRQRTRNVRAQQPHKITNYLIETKLLRARYYYVVPRTRSWAPGKYCPFHEQITFYTSNVFRVLRFWWKRIRTLLRYWSGTRAFYDIYTSVSIGLSRHAWRRVFQLEVEKTHFCRNRGLRRDVQRVHRVITIINNRPGSISRGSACLYARRTVNSSEACDIVRNCWFALRSK